MVQINFLATVPRNRNGLLADYKLLDLAIFKVYSMKHRRPNTEFTTPALADLCECGPFPVK